MKLTVTIIWFIFLIIEPQCDPGDNATQETASIFGYVKNQLKAAGTPLPINDVWIAAHGFECGATIITRDLHFSKIQGLRIWGCGDVGI